VSPSHKDDRTTLFRRVNLARIDAPSSIRALFPLLVGTLRRRLASGQTAASAPAASQSSDPGSQEPPSALPAATVKDKGGL